MDYFALLPPEIIQLIFNNLTPDDEGLRLPLSKSLLPFQHRRLFRSVKIGSYKNLSQACEAAQRPQSPFVYTESIYIRIQRWPGSSVSYHVHKVDDTFAPTDDEIRKFFRTLLHVKHPSITSPRLSSLILAPDVAHPILPNLIDLSLSSSFSDFDDPFDPSHYTSLFRYPNLHTLRLDVELDSSEVKPLSQPRPPFPSMSSKLVNITLRCPLSTCQASVTQLVNFYDSLESIDLSDTSDSSRLYDLISGLGVQPQLWRIGFDRCPSCPHPPRGSISDALLGFPRQFPNLEYLRIGGECDLTLPSFYDSLGNLSLSDLCFDPMANPSLTELTKLVSSGKMGQTLETITFDNVEGERGTLIEGPYDDDELDAMEDPPDWVLPKWTEEFNETTLTEFIKVAEREEIEVTGTATEASDIDVEYERECEKLGGLHYRREVMASW